jgi:hypothetical protein
MIIETREAIVEESVPLKHEYQEFNGCDNSKVVE